jgi:hypothetical protein
MARPHDRPFFEACDPRADRWQNVRVQRRTRPGRVRTPIRRRPSRTVETGGFDVVRAFGLALPDVEESTTYGTPSLKVRGKMFACIASHKSAEPNTLVVRVPFDQRDELIAADPVTYYLTDHYVGYASVLVRLARVDPDALRDLLLTAWRFANAGDRKRARPRMPAARVPARRA